MTEPTDEQSERLMAAIAGNQRVREGRDGLALLVADGKGDTAKMTEVTVLYARLLLTDEPGLADIGEVLIAHYIAETASLAGVAIARERQGHAPLQ